MSALSEAEYKSTMGTPMTPLLPEDDFQPIAPGEYLESIPPEDLSGHDFTSPEIDKVYREPTGRFIHVLLTSTTANVFLVIVVDELRQVVHGHCLLNLNREYGLS